MKLSVEIKEDKLIYSWKIGSSEANGTTEICPDTLICFASMLGIMDKAFEHSHENRMREMLSEGRKND